MITIVGINRQHDLYVRSFGSLLDAWSARRSSEHPAVSSSFAGIVFKQIYNRPLCSILASSSEPAFAGPCEPLPLACEDADGGCKREEDKTDEGMVFQGKFFSPLRPSQVVVCYCKSVVEMWKVESC